VDLPVDVAQIRENTQLNNVGHLMTLFKAEDKNGKEYNYSAFKINYSKEVQGITLHFWSICARLPTEIAGNCIGLVQNTQELILEVCNHLRSNCSGQGVGNVYWSSDFIYPDGTRPLKRRPLLQIMPTKYQNSAASDGTLPLFAMCLELTTKKSKYVVGPLEETDFSWKADPKLTLNGYINTGNLIVIEILPNFQRSHCVKQETVHKAVNMVINRILIENHLVAPVNGHTHSSNGHNNTTSNSNAVPNEIKLEKKN
jgi:hypothetical protein